MGAARVLMLCLLATLLAVSPYGRVVGNALPNLLPPPATAAATTPTPRPYACVVHGVCGGANAPDPPFHLLVFMTAWQRLPLTAAVLAHYARLRESPALAAARVVLAVHVAGSGGDTVAAVAVAAGATYSEHPNTPLGAKHVAGLDAGRVAHPASDGVVVVGSDDLLPVTYLVAVAERLRGGRSHVVGLADLGVVDLGGWQAAYSAGYRRGANAIASTVGLGRAYSAALLDALAPRGGLWEAPLQRGLDQSAARRLGASRGVDIKTGDAGGVNLWGYATLVGAGGDGPHHRLHRFERRSVDELVGAVGGDAALADLRSVRKALAGGGGGNASTAAER
ncbi:hypothetical protein MMPV_008230 [Pyropia vietnamensis]